MTSAGDVERFAYCPHNWLLARQGVDPHAEASHRGMAQHERKASEGTRAESARRDFGAGLRWSFRILAVAGSATFLTLEVIYLRASPLHWVFLTTALVLLSASAGLMTVGLDAERRMRHLQRKHGLIPGALLQQDEGGPDGLLEDPEWGLAGRPDQVLRTAEGIVPVEIKTGRTPDRPHENHVLQLACYLRLLEANGHQPPYGLINYPEGVFRIGWDDGLRERLRATIDKVEEAQRTGKADRDHRHTGRCRGCARREACDQRLV